MNVKLAPLPAPLLRLGVLLVLACVAALPQTNFAEIGGTITDAQGAPIQNAHVQMRSLETDAVRHVTSNTEGMFDLANLSPGDYTLDVDSTGFAQLSRSIHLEVGQNMRLDLALVLGQKHESLDVSAKTEMLKTSDASLGEVVETKSIQELPLNGRMLLDLVVTVPGAT